MSLSAIERWESILGINPFADDTIEDRRFRVDSRINERLPFTEKWLNNRLSYFVGNDGFTVDVDPENMHLTVKLDVGNKSHYRTIEEFLERTVPLNMTIDFVQLYNRHGEIEDAGHSHCSLSFFTHQEIREDPSIKTNVPECDLGSTIHIEFPVAVVDYPTSSWVKIRKSNLNGSPYAAFSIGGVAVPSFLDFEDEGMLYYTLKITADAGVLDVTYIGTNVNVNDGSMFDYIRDFRNGMPSDWESSPDSNGYPFDDVFKSLMGGRRGTTGVANQRLQPIVPISQQDYQNRVAEIGVLTFSRQNWNGSLHTDWEFGSNPRGTGIQSGGSFASDRNVIRRIFGVIQPSQMASWITDTVAENYLAGKPMPYPFVAGYSIGDLTSGTYAFIKSFDGTIDEKTETRVSSQPEVFFNFDIFTGNIETHYRWFRIRKESVGEKIIITD
jgi:hypothetical protein